MKQQLPVAIDELPKEGRYLRRIWWALIWRMVLWMVLFVAAVIVITENWLLNYPYIRHALQTFSVLSVFPFGYLALKRVINRPFKGCRLALISTEVAPPVQQDVAAQQQESQKTDTKTDE